VGKWYYPNRTRGRKSKENAAPKILNSKAVFGTGWKQYHPSFAENMINYSLGQEKYL
jgi:hypothetical protein